MIYSDSDTIAAIATPSGDGAISVIRVSGPNSIPVVDSLFHGKSKIIDSPSHRIHYGKIISNNINTIDDVLVSVFRNGSSYTGEDSVEISTHGNMLICEKIISILILNGIRLAEPGEFTKRAFLNGKMDLVQAEAVADIINARTEASLRGARNQLDGILSKKIDELRKLLIDTSSLLELELDFSEEKIELIALEKVQFSLKNILDEVELLLTSFYFGKTLRDGINVAIVGEPNVGKSSLLNYILKESRAIVSDIPGTTRDIIHEDVSIDGYLFRLYDTAGIRFSEDKLEKEGVKRSRAAVEMADLVIFLNDVQQGVSKSLYDELCNIIPSKKIIIVANKIDLSEITGGDYDVKISALTGRGIRDLLNLLKTKAFSSGIYSEKTAIITSLRHFDALSRAKDSLITAQNSLNQNLSNEFIAVDLRNAELILGEIIGKVTTEEILNNIFSKFCIGK